MRLLEPIPLNEEIIETSEIYKELLTNPNEETNVFQSNFNLNSSAASHQLSVILEDDNNHNRNEMEVTEINSKLKINNFLQRVRNSQAASSHRNK